MVIGRNILFIVMFGIALIPSVQANPIHDSSQASLVLEPWESQLAEAKVKEKNFNGSMT